MGATLYGLSLSHPAHAARLMLEQAGVEHRVVNFPPGMHPLLLRAVGFRGRTVPALKLDGRRVQGSLNISRALHERAPEAGLLGDPAVEEAERWGEQVLQPLPRRLFRWCASRSGEVRRWVAADVVGMPAPRIAAAANAPVTRWFARASRATDEAVRADLAALPELLDRVDELIARGTIGGERPNAADCQIATSVRALGTFPDLRPALEGRPAWDLALRLQPRAHEPVPAQLPADWLGALRR